jgi:hypothetical protein
MRYQGKGMTPLSIVAVVVAAGIALAAYSGAIATKPQAEALAATAAPAKVYQDPSLAGLQPGPDAEPGGDVAMYD